MFPFHQILLQARLLFISISKKVIIVGFYKTITYRLIQSVVYGILPFQRENQLLPLEQLLPMKLIDFRYAPCYTSLLEGTALELATDNPSAVLYQPG